MSHLDDPNEDTLAHSFQPLANDDATPSAPPSSNLDDTHPATDSNIDATELYDEGLSGAAEAEEPAENG